MLILKYLVELDWIPTVVTTRPDATPGMSTSHWSGMEIITISTNLGPFDRIRNMSRSKGGDVVEQRYEDETRADSPDLPTYITYLVGKILGPLSALRGSSFPDKYGRYSSAMLNVIDYLHHIKRFEAVLSISTPFTAHTVALPFTTKTRLPWIAAVKDYFSFPRDMKPNDLNGFVNSLKRRYERSVLKESDILLPHCSDIASHLHELLPNAVYRIITNCYDQRDFIGQLETDHNCHDRFTIVFAGSMYDYDHGMFFEAIQELYSTGLISPESFIVRFVGAEKDKVQAEVERYSCKHLVQVVDKLPYDEAINEIKQATCLLYRQKPGCFPRRTSEFIATRRPILAFPAYENTWSQSVLRAYGAAIIAANKEEIKTTLVNWHREFWATDKLSLPVNEDLVQSFSARHQAKEFNEVLEEAISQHRQRSGKKMTTAAHSARVGLMIADHRGHLDIESRHEASLPFS
ncbi:MAG: hypothetical protein QXX64_02575 [Nitrososphaera sp.]